MKEVTISGNEKLEEFPNVETSKWRNIYYNFIFLLLGAVNRLAISAFATNSIYFKQRVRNSTNLERFFDPSLVVCSMTPVLISNVVNSFYLNKFNRVILTIVPLLITLVGFALTTVIIFVNISDNVFFFLIMLVSFILNLVSPVMQTALFTQILYFKKSNLGVFLSGFSFSGIFVALIQMAVIPFNLNERNTAITYFCFSVAFIIICCIFYYLMTKTVDYKYGKIKFCNNSEKESSVKLGFKETFLMYRIIIKEKWIELMSVLLNFMANFCYWPTVIIKIRSVYPNTDYGDKYFVIINCFLFYALGDFISRNLSQFVKWPKLGSIWTFILSIVRFLFLFIFLVCNRPGVRNSPFPPILNHDVAPMITMLIWSFVSGHLVTRSFEVAHTYKDPIYAKNCNSLLVFSVGIGSFLGSFSSFGFALI